MEMVGSIILAVIVLTSGVLGTGGAKKKHTSHGTHQGGHQSQQYHYSSYTGGHGSGGYNDHGGGGGGHDVHGEGHDGHNVISVQTGLFFVLAVIIALMALVLHPILNYNHSDDGGGWRSLGKSYDLADTTNKVLKAVEKMYDTYHHETF